MPIVVLQGLRTPDENPANLWESLLQHRNQAANFAVNMYGLAQKETDPTNKALMSELAGKALINAFGGRRGVADAFGRNYRSSTDLDWEQLMKAKDDLDAISKKYALEMNAMPQIETTLQNDPQFQAQQKAIEQSLTQAGAHPNIINEVLQQNYNKRLNETTREWYFNTPTPDEFKPLPPHEPPGSNVNRNYINQYQRQSEMNLPLYLDFLRQF